MERTTAAFCHKYAPAKLHNTWHQVGLRRTLREWLHNGRKDIVEAITANADFGMVVGYHVIPQDTGQYGHDANIGFIPDIEEEYLEEIEGGEYAHEFFNEWVENLSAVIEEEQESTMLSSKEFATLLGHRHPRLTEKQVADALRITVGTYRGKVGRVKSKLESARNTIAIQQPLSEDESVDWGRSSISAPLSVILRVEEERLPVQAATISNTQGSSLNDIPVDRLLIDE